jgi:hypothetical protein
LKHPEEVRAWLARRYAGQHRDWLAAGDAAAHWPLSIPLGLPTEAAAQRQPEAVRAWAGQWRAWRGSGDLRWTERRWRVLGVQTLPDTLVLHDAEQAVAWIGEQERWRRAGQRYARTTLRWPALAPRLARHYDALADYADADFQRLLDLLAWLLEHPGSGLYPRQLPLAGIDSKWLEPRKGIVTELIAALRGGEEGGKDFYQLCGLKRPPSLLRMRVLDPSLRAAIGGLADISAPADTLAALQWRPATVIIVENLQTGLALQDLPGAVAFMGLGYAVDALAALPWLATAKCLYWGDIDTHGYAILNRARSLWPHLVSVMMDEATLLRFRDLCTEEKSQHGAETLDALTAAEQAMYGALRKNIWGQALRLEQERISWNVAWPALIASASPAPAPHA